MSEEETERESGDSEAEKEETRLNERERLTNILNWRIVDFTDEDSKRLEKLIEDQPEIRLLLTKREAHRHVVSTIRGAAVWFVAVVTVFFVGIDTLSAVIRGLVQ